MRVLAKVIDGEKIANKVYEEIREKVKGCRIGIIRTVTEDAQIYANVVKKNAGRLGVEYQEICLTANSTISEVCRAIEKADIADGIVLMGFKNIDLEQVYSFLPEKKDIEGMCAINLGYLYRGRSLGTPAPCTPTAIIKIIDEVGYYLEGKDVCVINHSSVIGKPLATMLLNRNATVSVCHAYTKNLRHYTLNADVVVCGVGIPSFLKEDMVKEDAFVIDCGMNRVNKRIVGDVDFDRLVEKCKFITPVPGGVGPVTTSMLFHNLAILMNERRKMEKCDVK